MPDSSIDKTLIIRFSSVGDIVLTTQLVRALRRRFPHSRVDYLVKAEYADLLRHNPHLSRLIEFPAHGKLLDLLQLRKSIRADAYDLVIDVHNSIRSRILCAGMRNVVRIRKRTIARFALVRFKRDIYGWFGGSPPVARRYLDTVKRIGIEDDGLGPELDVPPVAITRVSGLLQHSGIADSLPLIGMCPGSRHGNKNWLKERFAESGRALATECNGGIILFGSAEEAGLCEDVSNIMKQANPALPVLNAAGAVSLIETAALMDRCAVVLTNDSGLMHIAAARGRSLVAVFGPTVRQFGFFPTGSRAVVVEHPNLDCRPCTPIGLPSCPQGHFRCMNEIPAARVTEAARALMARSAV